MDLHSLEPGLSAVAADFALRASPALPLLPCWSSEATPQQHVALAAAVLVGAGPRAARADAAGPAG